jgi:plastocyanin
MGHLSIYVLTLALLAGCTGRATPAQTPTAQEPTTIEGTGTTSPSPSVPFLPAGCEDATVGRATATLRMQDNVFEPACLIALGGQNLRLVNAGANLHNLSVEGAAVDIDVPTGTTQTIEAIGETLPAGTFTIFCKYHRHLGMEGEVTITAVG